MRSSEAEEKFILRFRTLGVATAIASDDNPTVVQTNQSAAHRWVQSAEIAPPLTIPAGKRAWEKQRLQVQTQLVELLGELPPRPKVPPGVAGGGHGGSHG